MRFGDHVVMFNLGRIPMIGNLNNGFTIGLTPQGASLCARIYDSNITDEEAQRQDPELFAALRENDFLNEEKAKRSFAPHIFTSHNGATSTAGAAIRWMTHAML